MQPSEYTERLHGAGIEDYQYFLARMSDRLTKDVAAHADAFFAQGAPTIRDIGNWALVEVEGCPFAHDGDLVRYLPDGKSMTLLVHDAIVARVDALLQESAVSGSQRAAA